MELARPALSGFQFPSAPLAVNRGDLRMRFLLIVYLFLTPNGDPHPITVPQSTAASCEKAGQKMRADIQAQAPTATTVIACVDTGSAY
jgi:hypothetical protein